MKALQAQNSQAEALKLFDTHPLSCDRNNPASNLLFIPRFSYEIHETISAQMHPEFFIWNLELIMNHVVKASIHQQMSPGQTKRVMLPDPKDRS